MSTTISALSQNYQVTNARQAIDAARAPGQSLNILKFPLDIDSVPHKFLMNFRLRNTQTEITDNGAQIRPGTQIVGALVLPVPRQINEGYRVSYSSEDLGMAALITSAITNAAQGIQNAPGSISSYTDAVSGVVGAARDVASGLSAQSAALLATTVLANADRGPIGRLARAGQQAISNQLGLIINPFTTAVFQGVELRQYNYSWLCAPTSELESRALENIIKTIRFNMLPKRSSGGLTLDYPHEVEYQLIGSKPEFVWPTKPCVVKSFNVNRSPHQDAGPAFFAKTGAPAFIEMSMELLEIQPLIQDDINPNSSFAPPSSYAATVQPQQTANVPLPNPNNNALGRLIGGV